MSLPRLYTDLAYWWPILSSPADYAEEAEEYRKVIFESCHHPPMTLLELGSGGGNNASHLKAHFRMTLVDLSPAMLAVSKALNPECEHIQGDMRTVRLGKQFDVVFIHDAVEYMTTEADLRQAIETASAHCSPGGVALFCPDCTRATVKLVTRHGGHDGQGDDHRALRYLEWTWDPDPTDTSYVVDFAYLLRDEQGTMRVEYDHHEFGLFSVDDWLRLLAGAGFEPKLVILGNPELWEYGGGEVFVGIRPSTWPEDRKGPST
jgi:SAM-dependent methyltransferase